VAENICFITIISKKKETLKIKLIAIEPAHKNTTDKLLFSKWFECTLLGKL